MSKVARCQMANAVVGIESGAVSGGISQGSARGPALRDMFMTDPNRDRDLWLLKLADDAMMGGQQITKGQIGAVDRCRLPGKTCVYLFAALPRRDSGQLTGREKNNFKRATRRSN